MIEISIGGHMKKLILIAAILLLSTTAYAAPFIVCDPQAGVVGYEITGLGEPVTFVAQADGSLKYDLASVNNGTYTLTVAACNMWGCSSTAPFVFNKAIPAAPAGLRIAAE
jgi:hypothetical protein